ncbi:MAG: DUF4136 domain-containing protein [Gammaproteobacteria bacterium]|nr:DUF4136 domain-containing protein [Gammaproteobacteria bacterium]
MTFATRLLLTLVIIVGATACAPLVKYEHDPTADFSGYQTFTWISPEHSTDVTVDDPILDSELLENRVKHAVSQAMLEKGLRETMDGDADIGVTYHTSSRERIRSTGPRFSIGFHRGHHHGHHSLAFGHNFYDVDSYAEGTLIIDIIDQANERLVWRGWRSALVDQRQYSDEAVQTSVYEILQDFPPGTPQ